MSIGLCPPPPSHPVPTYLYPYLPPPEHLSVGTDHPLHHSHCKRQSGTRRSLRMALHGVIAAISLYALCNTLLAIRLQISNGRTSVTAWCLVFTTVVSACFSFCFCAISWSYSTNDCEDRPRPRLFSAKNSASTMIVINKCSSLPAPHIQNWIFTALFTLTALSSLIESYEIRSGVECIKQEVDVVTIAWSCKTIKLAVVATFITSLLWLGWLIDGLLGSACETKAAIGSEKSVCWSAPRTPQLQDLPRSAKCLDADVASCFNGTSHVWGHLDLQDSGSRSGDEDSGGNASSVKSCASRSTSQILTISGSSHGHVTVSIPPQEKRQSMLSPPQRYPATPTKSHAKFLGRRHTGYATTTSGPGHDRHRDSDMRAFLLRPLKLECLSLKDQQRYRHFKDGLLPYPPPPSISSNAQVSVAFFTSLDRTEKQRLLTGGGGLKYRMDNDITLQGQSVMERAEDPGST